MFDFTKEWNRFVNEIIPNDFDENCSNVKGTFEKLTKKHGKAYIEYLKVSWVLNDNLLSREEFCKINGNVPLSFIDKMIKK